jgi:hypothetical protein
MNFATASSRSLTELMFQVAMVSRISEISAQQSGIRDQSMLGPDP